MLSDDAALTDDILDASGGKGARVVFDPVEGPNARRVIRAMAPHGVYYHSTVLLIWRATLS